MQGANQNVQTFFGNKTADEGDLADRFWRLAVVERPFLKVDAMVDDGDFGFQRRISGDESVCRRLIAGCDEARIAENRGGWIFCAMDVKCMDSNAVGDIETFCGLCGEQGGKIREFRMDMLDVQLLKSYAKGVKQFTVLQQ